MGQFFWSLGLLLAGAVLNVTGVVLLRFAEASGNHAAAIAGCLCWAATAMPFLAFLASGRELAVVSVLTTSLGTLAVIAMGWLAFGESLTRLQLCGIALSLIGVAILSLERTS